VNTDVQPPSLKTLRVGAFTAAAYGGRYDYNVAALDADGKRSVNGPELRTDGIAGAYGRPPGGSSRQILMFIKATRTKARLVVSQ